MDSLLCTRSDVERLTLNGTFDGQRYELIEGQRIRKSGQSPPHAEIADSTSPHDSTVKTALYARALVPEYWVVDLSDRALFVHRHPSGGGYRQVIRLSEDDTISPDSRPDAVVKVSELLPPASPALC